MFFNHITFSLHQGPNNQEPEYQIRLRNQDKSVEKEIQSTQRYRSDMVQFFGILWLPVESGH